MRQMANLYKRKLPEPGETWRSYLGQEYKIICIAEDVDRLNASVVYQDKGGNYFVNSLHEFMSKAPNGKWRYERIDT